MKKVECVGELLERVGEVWKSIENSVKVGAEKRLRSEWKIKQGGEKSTGKCRLWRWWG